MTFEATGSCQQGCPLQSQGKRFAVGSHVMVLVDEGNEDRPLETAKCAVAVDEGPFYLSSCVLVVQRPTLSVETY